MVSKIPLHAIPLIRRYRCPCDSEFPTPLVGKYIQVVSMCTESIFDRVSLADAHNACRVSFVPDDIYSCNIAHTFEIKIFERTPMAVVPTLFPSYIHSEPSFGH